MCCPPFISHKHAITWMMFYMGGNLDKWRKYVASTVNHAHLVMIFPSDGNDFSFHRFLSLSLSPAHKCICRCAGTSHPFTRSVIIFNFKVLRLNILNQFRYANIMVWKHVSFTIMTLSDIAPNQAFILLKIVILK